jgi:MFS family permease
VLTEYLGWEWVLLVNTPITLVAAFFAPRLLVESRDERESAFDIPGAVSVTAGLALLVYGLVNAEKAGWQSGETFGILAGALVLLVAFVAIESRAKHPLMPFSIFRLRTLRGANIVGLLVGMSLFSMFFFISLYLQQVLGYEPLKAGFAYLPLALLIVVSAGGASQLVTRIGFKPSLVMGMIFIAAALLWFSQVSPGGTYVGDVLFPSMLAAVGLGFAFVPVTIAAVTGTEPGEAGLASGMLNTAQQIGGALGLAIAATVANSATREDVAGGERDQAVALTEGFQDAFLVCAAFAILGAVLAAVLISSKDSREQAEAARRGEVDVVPAAG